jgi:PAS domain S-box-containing protein
MSANDTRLTAEHVVAKALIDSATFEDAVPGLLDAFAQTFRWNAARAWRLDPAGEHLSCTTVCGRLAHGPLACTGQRLATGQGIAGRAWQARQPLTIADAAAVADLAGQVDLDVRAALALPIHVHGVVVVVLEFLSHEPRSDYGVAAEELAAVCRQIGGFIERQWERQEFERLFELSPDMLCICGFDGKFTRLNPAWYECVGYTEAEMIARPFIDFVHPDDIEPTTNIAQQLFAGQRVVHFENRYVHKDGSVRWLLWAAAPPRGNEQVVYAAARNITAHKEAEMLRARSASLAVIDQLLHALVDADHVAEVFSRATGIVRTMLPHDGAALLLQEPDGVSARLSAFSGSGTRLPDVTPIPDDIRNKPEWEHDVMNDLRLFTGSSYAALRSMGYESLLRVSLRMDGRSGGALLFLAGSPHAFNLEQVPVARRIADRLAVTLAREREVQASKRADEATARAATLEARVRTLTEELDARTGYRRVVGESREWRQVLRQAAQVAATDTTALLLGESGTGKEVVARFIHRGSARNGGPFVALNCAALPEQLLEAELFGYERGAYTGATQSKPGQIEQAAGGTLFLDEVAEMSLTSQAKFLRVLQEREFQRLGGTRLLRADVRIVAATNRDLPRAIANNAFREDLYYRLNVFAIRLPPLRVRRDDILPLSAVFLTEIGRGLGRTPAGLSRDAKDALLSYQWPGNVRELRNVLERATILCDGGLIVAEHLAISPAPPAIAPVPVPMVLPAATVSPTPPPLTAAPPSTPAGNLDAMERAMIVQALEAARFNKSKAAQALGLTRRQLYIRMRKYGLD